jgi:hypothetical protein
MPKDKVDRILDAARKRDAIDRAIDALARARTTVDEVRKHLRLVSEVSYATNRMGCVTSEIDAALKGLRRERGNASRAIAQIGRSK